MEQIYKNKMQAIGYDQSVCDIFINWEDVKDELLIPERKKRKWQRNYTCVSRSCR